MLNVVDRMYLAALLRLTMAREAIREKVHEFWEEEKGSTATIVVEIVMVGMILVLAFIFRNAIGDLFASLWKSLVHFDANEDKPTPSVGEITNPFKTK